MRSDCERWSRACPVCAFTREPRLNLPPLQPIVAEAPFDLLCLDILKLGVTTEGNRYVLVCVDHFSKFLIVEPLKTKSAEEVAKAILNKVVLIHGAPRKIHSDKGKEFVNSVVEHLRKILQVDQSTTAGYNPRANRVTERVNRDIIKMLQKSCVIPQEWDVRLPFVVFCHNITMHSSTGESPYFVIHGRDANFPSQVDAELVPRMYADAHGFKEWVTENVNEVSDRVRANLEKARAQYKKYYDVAKKVNKDKYSLGQRVMVYDPKTNTSENRKLVWKYYGPFRIIELEGSNAKVRPVDKPNAKAEWLPLDRLGRIPEECELQYEGKKARERHLHAPRVSAICNTDGVSNPPIPNNQSDVMIGGNTEQAEVENQSDQIETQQHRKQYTPLINMEVDNPTESKTIRSANAIFAPKELEDFCNGTG